MPADEAAANPDKYTNYKVRPLANVLCSTSGIIIQLTWVDGYVSYKLMEIPLVSLCK